MFIWMIFQIIIESLPISSSGHILLLKNIYTTLGYVWQYDYLEHINFLFHLSAIGIMLFYFFNQWSMMVIGKKFEMKDLVKLSTYEKAIKPIIFVLTADIMTFVLWKVDIANYFYIQKYFLPFGFFITAIMLYQTKHMKDKNIKNYFSLYHAILLGLVQGFAFLPGISRFAATFFATRFIGYNLKDSFALSFLIQFPLVCAAVLYAFIQLQNTIFTGIFNLPMLFGMVVLTFLSYKIFCMVGSLIEKNKIWYFSYYMLIPIMFAILF